MHGQNRKSVSSKAEEEEEEGAEEEVYEVYGRKVLQGVCVGRWVGGSSRQALSHTFTGLGLKEGHCGLFTLGPASAHILISRFLTAHMQEFTKIHDFVNGYFSVSIIMAPPLLCVDTNRQISCVSDFCALY